MLHTFLIFDFGSNEDAAQQARHSVEGWRQGFRLGQKLMLKFDRQEAAKAGEGEKKKPAAGDIKLMVRLDFSDHEKLSYQRWLERLPGEAVFKDAKAKVLQQGDADFEATAEKFQALK